MPNRWKLLYQPANEDGHKVFIDTVDGRVSLADWSGHAPHETDDGPLIVKPEAIVTITWSNSYGLTFVVPVYVTRTEEEGTVWTTEGTIRALVPKMNLRFLASKYFERLEKRVRFARGLLDVCQG